MSTAVAKMLGLEGRQIVFRASGFGDSFTQDPDAIETEVIISDAKETFSYRTHLICIANPLGDLTPDNWRLLKQDWPHLKDLPLAPVLVDEQVQMIIGTDNVHLLAAREGDIIGPDGGPGARKTVFGWVARGRLYPEQPAALVNLMEDEIDSLCINYQQYHVREVRPVSDTRLFHKFSQPPELNERRQKNYRELQTAYDKDLLELLKLQYQIDDAPQDEPDMSLEDRYAFRKMKASERHTGQRYEVDCLWKKGEPKLVHNKLNAVGRYQRLQRNPLYKSKFLPVYESTLKRLHRQGLHRRGSGGRT
jgi:hypothetical protein